jgi:hypothetical protein
MSVRELLWNRDGRPAALATVALACVAASLAPAAASAEKPAARSRPVQLALLKPVQVFGEDTSVSGFRLNVFLGVNRDVTGFDLSAVAGHTLGTQRGVQLGLVNQVLGDCTGAQTAALGTSVEGRLRGVQIAGLVSLASEGSGVQIAPFLAHATEFSGFQLGLFTSAGEMKGLQLGLLNFNENGFLPIFPLFNFGL